MDRIDEFYPDDRDDHNRSEMIWNTLISPCQDPLDLLSDLVIFAYFANSRDQFEKSMYLNLTAIVWCWSW